MGKFIRFMLMFGPMIYKGVNKFIASRKKENQDPPAPPSNQEQE